MPAARVCGICGGVLDEGTPNDVCHNCIVRDLLGAEGDHTSGTLDLSRSGDLPTPFPELGQQPSAAQEELEEAA